KEWKQVARAVAPSPACGGGLGWGQGRCSRHPTRACGAPPSRPSPASGGRGGSGPHAPLVPPPRAGEGWGGGGRQGGPGGGSGAWRGAPPAGGGGGGGGGQGQMLASSNARLRRAPIPAFPRKRGKGWKRAARAVAPSPACGGGLGWGGPAVSAWRSLGCLR